MIVALPFRGLLEAIRLLVDGSMGGIGVLKFEIAFVGPVVPREHGWVHVRINIWIRVESIEPAREVALQKVLVEIVIALGF